jgi:hypothetical protein
MKWSRLLKSSHFTMHNTVIGLVEFPLATVLCCVLDAGMFLLLCRHTGNVLFRSNYVVHLLLLVSEGQELPELLVNMGGDLPLMDDKLVSMYYKTAANHYLIDREA